MQDQPNRPRTRTLDNLTPGRHAPIAKVRIRRAPATGPTSPIANVPMAVLVEHSKPTMLVPRSTLDDLRRRCSGIVTRDELVDRIRRTLADRGTDDVVIDLVIRHSRPESIEGIARAIGAIDPADIVVEEVGGSET